jgi:hypothetical protein
MVLVTGKIEKIEPYESQGRVRSVVPHELQCLLFISGRIKDSKTLG